MAVSQLIQSLIDKQDSFEVIRAQIYQILVENIAEQKILAAAAGKDPLLWDIEVYQESSNPFEKFMDDEISAENKIPIVNIWFENESFDSMASSIVDEQKTSGTFNIDIYGYGETSENGTGQSPGDKTAALEAHRGLRLVRNILMSSYYAYLELNPIVVNRWPDSINIFQPQIDSTPVEKVLGARLSFKVEFVEYSPQYEGEALELLSIGTAVSDNEDEDILTDFPKI